LTGWESGDALEASLICFSSWFSHWTKDGARETEQAINQVRAFVQEHESRFERISGDRVLANRAGYSQNGEFWIIPSVFNSEVCSGLRPLSVKKSLAASGYLVSDEDGRRDTRRRASGKQQRFYVITDTILGDSV